MYLHPTPQGPTQFVVFSGTNTGSDAGFVVAIYEIVTQMSVGNNKTLEKLDLCLVNLDR